jgi:hypothetical protein
VAARSAAAEQATATIKLKLFRIKSLPPLFEERVRWAAAPAECTRYRKSVSVPRSIVGAVGLPRGGVKP